MRSDSNLILSPGERAARRETKRRAVLRFLRQHLWSTQEILQQVMVLKSRQATHKTLTQMESETLLRRHTIQALGGCITLWGVTPHGQSMAFDIDTEQIVKAHFEPSKISEQNIRHQLDLQKLRIVAESMGWTHWQDGDRLGQIDKMEKRPDAIARDPEGRTVACECERTFKSLKRLEQVLVSYLKLIKAGQIHCVVWICPTDEMALRLKAIFTSITSVRINGQKVLIEPERHHRNLHFCSYADWPDYER